MNNSRDYLEALGAALARTVPARERMDILRYYKEYFEDAGPEREQEIIDDLGDPEALAQRIIAEGGYGEDGGQPQAQQPQAEQYPPQSGGAQKRRVWPYVLLGVGAVALIAALYIVPRMMFSVVRNVAQSEGAVELETQVTAEDKLDRPAVDPTDKGVGEFDEISVKINMGNVTIQTGDAFNLSLREAEGVPKDADFGLDYSVSNGRLEVWSNGSYDLTDLKDFHNYSGGVTITVPTYTVLEAVNVNTDMGDVTLVNVRAEYVDVVTGMGNIAAHELLGVNELYMNTGMGDITLEGDLALETDLETGMGDVRVQTTCLKEECDYELECGMGEVKVNGRSCGRSTEYDSQNDIYELDATSGMGDVRVDFAG